MENTTIKDIAKAAGVSKATVSRVLNNPSVVEEKTRKNILRIMKETHYNPSAAARSLSMKSTSTIGVIIPEVDNTFFGEMLRGIIEIADKNDLTVICCNTDDDMDKDLKALDMLASHWIRGLLYVPAVDYSDTKARKVLTEKIKGLNAPVVQLDRDVELGHDGVYFNDYQALYVSVGKLAKLGHRSIAIINGSLDSILARQRQKGYLDGMKAAGIPVRDEYVLNGEYSQEAAYTLSKKLMHMQKQPTAVITCNNQLSKGFLRAAAEERDDTDGSSLCGGGIKTVFPYETVFLDRIEMLDILGVPYNHIERDAHELGRKGMELLIQRMAFPERPQQKVILEAPVIGDF